jgi:hypothetical protein
MQEITMLIVEKSQSRVYPSLCDIAKGCTLMTQPDSDDFDDLVS